MVGSVRWRVLAAMSCVSLLAGCCIGPSEDPLERARSHRGGSPGPCPAAGPAITPGAGTFSFTGYAPLADRPVRVWYVAPEDPATAEIVFVMHGMERNGEEYRDDWEALVRGRNVLVVVPEFSEDAYPGTSSYNLGNMVDSDGDPVPEEQWSFHIIEALFDFVVCEVGSTAGDYAIFGHSAGAQFVHRFLEFMPAHRARAAVAANAGWYTFLDKSEDFPYGLDGNPVDEETTEAALASNLIVLLGADDIDDDDDSLNNDDRAREQGRHRLERGMRFYLNARALADRESVPFGWRLATVPGIAHSHTDMAAYTASLLFDRKDP